MNHKILEQIKGGAFLAGDLPMSSVIPSRREAPAGRRGAPAHIWGSGGLPPAGVWGGPPGGGSGGNPQWGVRGAEPPCGGVWGGEAPPQKNPGLRTQRVRFCFIMYTLSTT